MSGEGKKDNNMKILQFYLVAFGLFTDKTLDFSANKPGLHILYGDNEAGKSTMRRALTHLFFGIPERTPDAYFHANDQLRIGARLLNSNGEELICYRRKGRKNTLLDAHNKPLDEKRLQLFLGGMNEIQFTTLCCFDHEHLRQGGEDLLNGGGNVGESLFEAGTGTLKVHDVLAELDKEKEELFKVRGSKPLLNKTIRDYKEACKRVDDSSLSPTLWNEHAKNLDEAQLQHIQLTHQLQTLRAEQHRLERIQRTRPLLQRHQELKAEQAFIAQVILLPDDAASKHFEVKLALRTAQAQEQQAHQDIAKLQSQIEAIKIPQALLAHKTTLDDLRGRLGSHQKAARDLPGVRTEMRTVESEARARLRRIYPHLDLKDVPTTLAVTNQQREHLKRLAEKAPALHEKQRNIAKRLEEVTEQLAQHHNALEALPIPPALTVLRATLTRACQYGNLEEIQAKDESEVRLLTERANIGLKQTGWTSTLESLEQAALPRMERIDSFFRRFNEFENDRQRIKERLLEARQRNERSTQKINALSWAGEIPTEGTLAKARKVRQKHWQKIKQLKSPKEKGKTAKGEANISLFDNGATQTISFDDDDTNLSSEKEARRGINQLYEAFEDAILYADEFSDRLRREANRVAEYSMLLAEQQSALSSQELQTKKWYTVEALIAKLQNEWEDSWKSLDIKPWTPAEMRGWLNECLSLRQQASVLRERRRQLEEQQQLITRLCQELTQALTPLKAFVKGAILTRLSDLIAQGNVGVTEVTNLQRQRENLQLEINHLTIEQQRTEAAGQQANNALKQWQTDWAQAITPLQLPADTPPETARNVLNDLDQVLNKIDKANGLRRRVELMLKDAEVFRREVATLVQKIAPELVNDAAEQIVPELSNRLSQAEKDLTRSEQLQHRYHAEQQRLAHASQLVQTSQAHLQALLEQAHCNDLVSLEEAEQASEHKKEVQQELAQVEQQLLEQGEGMSLAGLANAAAAVEIDQLPGQLQSYQEQIQQLEQERSTIDQSIGELRTLIKQMDGNANAAQAADEVQLALAEMQNLSERYMQIHLAASVLRKSMEQYREQHQGPVVKRAGELFQRLTLNSFCGLKTDYTTHNDQPILVGLRTPESTGIFTSGMSDGTRDQLYLALRLASIERHIAEYSQMPLILDDILVNFDDDRSKAAFEVLGELSKKTQILFLTHHPRLVEIAQAAVPSKCLIMHQL
ncbi:MAG: hypothetical protein DRR08_26605 [Candidatus Parabeggiatoa sp. nov. 2]|nr:MAG: hypothetical protein B6247_26780 [Beggiatoa sp. 4572_84]RKZ54304.1 MAG: hypothetical protein DRR08_26605 [Gammaproteobacteria bacterium]